MRLQLRSLGIEKTENPKHAFATGSQNPRDGYSKTSPHSIYLIFQNI